MGGANDSGVPDQSIGVGSEENAVSRYRLEQRLDRLITLFDRFASATVNELQGINHRLSRKGDIMAAIDDLKAAVASEDTAIDAIVAYLQSVVAQLGSTNSDDPAVEAVVADINQHISELQAAVPATPTSGDGSGTPTDGTDDNPTNPPVSG